ncbi:hypothetical protein AGMMS49556_09610 [Endomicrobiia bacterium]|nr:hypothetical protein AGMMS49556_09610 [Endomicrobiia bacterium]
MKQKKKACGNRWNGFRRLMGVKKGTFDKTVRIARSKKRKGGRQEEQREN